jgi:hypothetical protein
MAGTIYLPISGCIECAYWISLSFEGIDWKMNRYVPGHYATRVICRFAALIALVAGPNPASAQAEMPAADAMLDSVSAYAGQGVNHSLINLAGRIAGGRVDWRETFFTALGAGKELGTLGQRFYRIQGTPFASARHGYEVTLIQHRGLQSNVELGVAGMLRTPDLHLWALSVNFGIGAGLSYALGNPRAESRTLEDAGKQYRAQILGLVDVEWRIRGMADVSLITRVHHRSGMYGLVAPKGAGSNFLALGVRYRF